MIIVWGERIIIRLSEWESFLSVEGNAHCTCLETLPVLSLHVPDTQNRFYSWTLTQNINLSASRLYHNVVHQTQKRPALNWIPECFKNLVIIPLSICTSVYEATGWCIANSCTFLPAESKQLCSGISNKVWLLHALATHTCRKKAAGSQTLAALKRSGALTMTGGKSRWDTMTVLARPLLGSVFSTKAHPPASSQSWHTLMNINIKKVTKMLVKGISNPKRKVWRNEIPRENMLMRTDRSH